MGFGEKTDFKTNRKLNLDKTYRIIRDAVEEAGLDCIRGDDIIQSGVIDKPMYEYLLLADVAIADLSTSNENAIYELGVRHALKQHTTIVIAEKQFRFPFDLNHVMIRPYEHLGSGIDFEEAQRLKNELVTAITAILDRGDVDSPVYTFLPDLQPPSIGAADGEAGKVRIGGGAEVRAFREAELAHDGHPSETFSSLSDAFRQAKRAGDNAEARRLLAKLREVSPEDPYLIQQEALATYKGQQPTVLESLREARQILEVLEPRTSGDPETLGLWGAVHKRLWEETADRAALDEGITAYERGFHMKRDYYTGINYVFLLNERVLQQENPDEAIADRVVARRVAGQLMTIVEDEIATMPRDENGAAQDPVDLYWRTATRVEALAVLGDPRYVDARDELFRTAPEPWMRQATERQLELVQRQKAAAGER